MAATETDVSRSTGLERRRTILALKPAIPVQNTTRHMLINTANEQSQITSRQLELLEDAERRATETQSQLEEFFKRVNDNHARVIDELISKREADYLKERAQRDQELKNREEIHARELAQRDAELKARDEQAQRAIAARDSLLKKVLEEQERSLKALNEKFLQNSNSLMESFKKGIKGIGRKFVQYVQSENRKNNEKRNQDNIGTRFGTGVAIAVTTVGTIIIFTLDPSATTISVLVGLSSISLGLATSTGKIWWKKIKSFADCIFSDCCRGQDSDNEVSFLDELDLEDKLPAPVIVIDQMSPTQGSQAAHTIDISPSPIATVAEEPLFMGMFLWRTIQRVF